VVGKGEQGGGGNRETKFLVYEKKGTSLQGCGKGKKKNIPITLEKNRRRGEELGGGSHWKKKVFPTRRKRSGRGGEEKETLIEKNIIVRKGGGTGGEGSSGKQPEHMS